MKLTEIKYFHPSGAKLPNGSHYQKGGFLYECRKNANSFVTDGSTSERQCRMAKHRGGIIVFPITENAERLANLIKQFDDESLGAYSLGNFFKGKYVGGHGELFRQLYTFRPHLITEKFPRCTNNKPWGFFTLFQITFYQFENGSVFIRCDFIQVAKQFLNMATHIVEKIPVGYIAHYSLSETFLV